MHILLEIHWSDVIFVCPIRKHVLSIVWLLVILTFITLLRWCLPGFSHCSFETNKHLMKISSKILLPLKLSPISFSTYGRVLPETMTILIAGNGDFLPSFFLHVFHIWLQGKACSVSSFPTSLPSSPTSLPSSASFAPSFPPSFYQCGFMNSYFIQYIIFFYHYLLWWWSCPQFGLILMGWE